MRTLVASIDPAYRAPAEVYIFPNGRVFLENQNPGTPAPTPPPVPAGAYHPSADEADVYYTSADPTVYYIRN